jgi:hypothetical protein
VRGAEVKIRALRIQPIARVVAAIYAIFGAAFWIAYCFSKAPYLTLPVGIVAPWLIFGFNFHFHRTTDVAYNVLLFLGSVAGYALTGWLTGTALVVCFNVAARWKGGIDADFISFRENGHPEMAQGQESKHSLG